MSEQEDHARNMSARLLPQSCHEELPAVRVGDALVFVYWKDGVLRVTVDTEDFEVQPAIRVNVNDGTVFEQGAES